MALEFVIRRPTALTSIDAILNAFGAQSPPFTFLDGTAVDFRAFPTPKGPKPMIPNKREYLQAGQHLVRVLNANLGTTIGGVGSFPIPLLFRVAVDPAPEALFEWGPYPPNPQTTQLGNLEQSLIQDIQFSPSRFVPAHPFPMYQRLGYPDLSHFLAGYTWRYDPAPNGTLLAHGKRALYTLIVPITNRTTNNVVFNFYPKSSSNQKITNMDETADNSPYFAKI
jgi:hypothetical protein